MSESDLTKLTCRQYAETAHQGWGEFHARGDSDVIYLHAGSRLRVQLEQHSQPGFGFDRMEAIDETAANAMQNGKRGVSCAERDADEFVDDFIRVFCEHLSIRQLNALIPALIEHRADREMTRPNLQDEH